MILVSLTPPNYYKNTKTILLILNKVWMLPVAKHSGYCLPTTNVAQQQPTTTTTTSTHQSLRYGFVGERKNVADRAICLATVFRSPFAHVQLQNLLYHGDC